MKLPVVDGDGRWLIMSVDRNYRVSTIYLFFYALKAETIQLHLLPDSDDASARFDAQSPHVFFYSVSMSVESYNYKCLP